MIYYSINVDGSIEFDCIDCGRHVIAYGYPYDTQVERCSTCAWIIEHVPPEHQEAIRKQLDVELNNLRKDNTNHDT